MPHDYPTMLKELRLKVTPKRLAILDFLARAGTYVSPEEVQEWAKEKAAQDEEKKREVDKLIDSKLPRNELSDTSSRQYSNFVAMYDTASEADEVVEWIRSLDGVNSVKMGIVREIIVVHWPRV